MKFDIDDIRDRILECATLFAFEYDGHLCDVDPFNRNFFRLGCDGKQIEVHSIDEVFDTPYFSGKALKEIADEIEILEW